MDVTNHCDCDCQACDEFEGYEDYLNDLIEECFQFRDWVTYEYYVAIASCIQRRQEGRDNNSDLNVIEYR